MNGRIFVGAFVLAALLFGGFMAYFKLYGHYEQVSGISEISSSAGPISVAQYQGLDGTSSPNKLRGCFTADPADFTGLPEAPEPEPLIAPGWFECFDAERLSADLASGAARAFLLADETKDGAVGYRILRIAAIYPDGRGYLWRHYRGEE